MKYHGDDGKLHYIHTVSLVDAAIWPVCNVEAVNWPRAFYFVDTVLSKLKDDNSNNCEDFPLVPF